MAPKGKMKGDTNALYSPTICIMELKRLSKSGWVGDAPSANYEVVDCLEEKDKSGSLFQERHDLKIECMTVNALQMDRC
jgi:hypothetical protein